MLVPNGLSSLNNSHHQHCQRVRAQTYAHGPWSAITESQWQGFYTTAVQSLRAQGWTCPLLIDILNYGEDFTCVSGGYAAAILAADPLQNVIFSFHLYNTDNTVVGIRSIATSGSHTLVTFNTNSSSSTHPLSSSGIRLILITTSGTVYLSGVQGLSGINGWQPVNGTNPLGGVAGAWTLTLAKYLHGDVYQRRNHLRPQPGARAPLYNAGLHPERSVLHRGRVLSARAQLHDLPPLYLHRGLRSLRGRLDRVGLG